MKSSTASLTALGTAAGRAVESSHFEKDRLFEDQFARNFLKAGYRVIVDLLRLPVIGNALLAMKERQLPGIMGNLLCRTRFIDDVLKNALENGFDQIVILGAGFDSRAYRIPGIEQTRVFEVDHPATQAWKQDRLKKILGSLPSHVTFVPIDFNRQNLEDVMSTTDFRTDAKTFFIWEGVSQYITTEAVDAVFQFTSKATGMGSEIAFTYINLGFIDGSIHFQGREKLISNLKRQGEPWIFGLDPSELSRYLAAREFSLIDHVGVSEYKERYLNPLGRQMDVFEGERVALAQITGTKRD
jgi:methyltransferase (TIGR00027 family)